MQPAGKILLVFFVWLLIGSLYADTSWHEKIKSLSSWKKLVFTFILLGLFYQAYWKKLFVLCFLSAMTIAALISTPCWLADITLIPGSIRGPGIFMTTYSSHSMAFIAAIICCIILLAQPLSRTKKWLLTLLIGLFVVNVFFVSSARSAYVALPVALIFTVFCLYGYKKLPQVILAVSVLLIIVALTSSTLQQRVMNGLSEKSDYQHSEKITSVGIRVIFAENTLELIRQNPLFGYGTSSFTKVYSSHVAKKYTDWRNDATADPHNQYLFVWLENGLIGLIVFFAYIVIAIRQGLANPPYGTMAASFLVAVCVSSLFNSHFKTFAEGNLLAFYVGILLAHKNTDNTSNVDKHPDKTVKPYLH
jgi:O-antigen ligase